MLFRDTPGIFVSALAVCLLLAASYCMRVAEAPANRFHSSHFWNNLWFIVVTASTVGYGDNVPSTHLGRLISVAVIIMGTIIISMMTAAATEWLILNQQETFLFEHAKSARSNRRVTESVTAYLQYVWRRGKGKIKEDLVKRNTLRKQFWNDMHRWRTRRQDSKAAESRAGLVAASKVSLVADTDQSAARDKSKPTKESPTRADADYARQQMELEEQIERAEAERERQEAARERDEARRWRAAVDRKLEALANLTCVNTAPSMDQLLALQQQVTAMHEMLGSLIVVNGKDPVYTHRRVSLSPQRARKATTRLESVECRVHGTEQGLFKGRQVSGVDASLTYMLASETPNGDPTSFSRLASSEASAYTTPLRRDVAGAGAGEHDGSQTDRRHRSTPQTVIGNRAKSLPPLPLDRVDRASKAGTGARRRSPSRAMARATLARLQGKISELELQKFDLGIARRTGKK